MFSALLDSIFIVLLSLAYLLSRRKAAFPSLDIHYREELLTTVDSIAGGFDERLIL